MTTYYKAIRPDGTDFYSGTVQWAPAKTKARKGRVVKHPTADRVGSSAAGYLSVSVEPTDCTGMRWPCRLLEVEPVGDVSTPEPEDLPNKRAAVEWRVVAEIDPVLALGPNGAQVAAYLAKLSELTASDWSAALGAARSAAESAARGAARNAARIAAFDAAWIAARIAAGAAAGNAAGALVVRDLITPAEFDALAAPMKAAGINFEALS